MGLFKKKQSAPHHKKSAKEIFQSITFYASASLPVIGAAGGGYLGATSAIVSSVLGATALGAAGVAVGLAGGALAGAATYFAANAVYENKEYIIAGAALAVTLPFVALGRGLKSVFGRNKKPDQQQNAKTATPAAQNKNSALTNKTLKQNFEAEKQPKKTKQDKKPAPQTKTKNTPKNGKK